MVSPHPEQRAVWLSEYEATRVVVNCDAVLMDGLMVPPAEQYRVVHCGGAALFPFLSMVDFAELAVNDPAAFKAVVETAKKALPADVNAPKA